MSLSEIVKVFLLLILSIGIAKAQQCPGGLGQNLFANGDFGSGTTFSLQTDPQLAPGYTYVLGGPPNDGEYMITSQVSRWNSVWPTWLVIGDNSPDPDGYMMVVNASFEPGLFYEEIVNGLCDDTFYEFSADIINMIRTGVSGHSDPNVAFLINDEVVLETGDIPKNEMWNNYSFSFSTLPGQTSVSLSLRNNAPGGTGNDLALDNISFRACGGEAFINEIRGESRFCEENLPMILIATIADLEDNTLTYQWEVSLDSMITWEVIPGATQSRLEYQQAITGELFFRFATASTSSSFANERCRFFSSSAGFYISQRIHERFDTICGGTFLELETGNFQNPGLYVEELMSTLGCDSIVMVHLDTVQREVLTADIAGIDPICFGAATGVIEVTNVNGGNPPYHLEVNGADHDGLIANDLIAGDYSVLVEDRFNCFGAFEFQLIEGVELQISIGPDQELLLGEESHIVVSSNLNLDTIYWSSPLEMFNGEYDITFLPLEDMVVNVQAHTAEGCEDTDGLNITLDTEVAIYMPNIFAPLSDGENSTYYISPYGRSLGGIATFNIYDRWGGLVWTASPDEDRWDGKDLNNDFVVPGVYVYLFEGNLINGDPINKTGTITVIY